MPAGAAPAPTLRLTCVRDVARPGIGGLRWGRTEESHPVGVLDILAMNRHSAEVHVPSGATFLERCYLAEGTVARAIGLLGTARLAAGVGLLLPGCRSVHTFGMRFSIVCVWLGPGGVVLRVDDGLQPGRVSCCPGAIAVIERAAAGTVDVGRGAWICSSDGRLRAALGRIRNEKCAICDRRVSGRGERTPPEAPLVRDGQSGPDG